MDILESTPIVSPSSGKHEDIENEQVQSDIEETDCDDFLEGFSECNEGHCAYGSGDNTTNTIYVFAKCQINACVGCLNQGAHSRHKQFITIYSSGYG